ncbi:MAG: (E)-4-hydroxy-3-methylbut-2-enyl-diphosphate synthase [Bacteroidales bacterium]|nr:(E)-4-hydroxy-3-methylbut-2-enyl-diphosphate synthase [Bacteroidales bacterium]
MAESTQYTERLISYKRFTSREVQIGNTPMGGHHPVRIQSMTNTNTLDTQATVEQAIRMIEAGSEYVRITAPTVKDAENLADIKKELLNRGYNTPLIADIHYNPKAAEVAAGIVEKVRINPGNYIDKNSKGKFEFTPEEYQYELEKIRERIEPLIRICKKHGTAIRIGSNHGSLSDRIIGRFGDTAQGMVEAAMEFIRILEDLEFYNTVISMKASNTRVMVQSTRLLIEKMQQEGMAYPLHLGVTEAGEGEEGRIKSSIGIGTLLSEGIGDTIRVSLTEAPEKELPVARKLIDHFTGLETLPKIILPDTIPMNPFEYDRRKTNPIAKTGGTQVPVVMINCDEHEVFTPDQQADFCIQSPDDLVAFISIMDTDLNPDLMQSLKKHSSRILILETQNQNPIAAIRSALFRLSNAATLNPVIIKLNVSDYSDEDLQIKAAGICGTIFNDGLADGIYLSGKNDEAQKLNRIAFSILQASRSRITKTEFISCPTCGRTLFDMAPTLLDVKEKLSHLKGLKIGIMGCIVNGPGEMADADYGYVGAGPAKVNLYKGKECVEKSIPQDQALDKLIALIKAGGDWNEA